jgi:flagellar hook-length control protein FliK
MSDATTLAGKAAKADKGALAGLDPTAAQKAALDTSSNQASQTSKDHDAKFMATLEAMKAAQTGKDVATPAVAATPLTGASERNSADKPLSRTAASDAQLGPAPTSASAPSPTVYAPTATGQAAAATDFQVAQQVSYWISQDVHNAELKLDGLGKSAVEVSISMSGNEAHVMFRTNEADTRNLLEGSASHLRDMLMRDGVVLSGVSVGTSGSGDSRGGDSPRSRQGARQTGLVAVAAAQGDGHRARAAGAGRTLDLFV